LLEKISKDRGQSQIFIETPYRNEKMFDDLKSALHPETRVCIAADITLNSEYIKTYSIKEWSRVKPDLHKRPAIFIIQR
jgi:16S rRNA (cytidine1402-2'-O)-methyltransferase